MISGDRRGGFTSGQVDRRRALAATVGGGLALSSLARSAGAASGVRTLQSPEQLRSSYDYVIVGAGSSGCVVAHRLALAGRRVLLVEAGGEGTLAAIRDPQQWPKLQGSEFDWRYLTTPQPGLGGRIIRCPRGKVVGGSSTINALAYQRGHPAAYDRWAEGWRAADLLPYFKRAETFSGGASAWRGGGGPLHVLSLADVPDRNPVATAFVEASQDLGYRMSSDIGGEVTTGVGWNQLSIKEGSRDDAATAYLGSLEAVTLDLLTNTEVLGLVIEGGRCIGVRLAERSVRAESEVLLCAGAIDSPRLLMLSGIGPADQLRSFGIPVVVDQPDVGRHLEDHLLVAGVAYAARREVPRSHYNHADALLYAPHTDPGDSPDHLVMCLSLPFVLPSVGPLPPPAYVLVSCLMRPRSRGNVKLASGNPRVPALIDPNYLSDPADLDLLVEGVSLAREIGAGAAFADWRAHEVYPGPEAKTASDLRTFAISAADSFHHPVGTCRIGAVVDEALRVKGVAGLRVIDASVFPGIPQAMTNAATIAVAEKASDLVLAG
ncbi:GMC family oxidoreductase N-terminal domain-containing protein [Bradyrhizobium sp. Ai1a-2]|uniref:GMC family oxidoreductase n=1 Tax=Bradyrhizobium sp. Ai1a-2 TaxID=196490 RepID=UPI0003FEB9DF|nr:GMC family oxidoreductase N-terminal domain-containing protein [Bradyrhizobium sp. Ai1a-2]